MRAPPKQPPCHCRLPEAWSLTLVSELRAINASAARALQQGLLRVWPAFVYEGGCALDLFLMELVLRMHRDERSLKDTSGSSRMTDSPLVSLGTQPLNTTVDRDSPTFGPRLGVNLSDSFLRWGATNNSIHHFWSPTRGNFYLLNSAKVGASWGAGAVPH